jgi:predicted thioredoxin/glutaredoxin
MKSIQIFGVGCVKYRTLLANLRQALAKADIDVKVEEFDDIQLFFDKKIAVVPSLLIDQQIVSQGIVLDVEQLFALLHHFESQGNKQK